MTCYICGQPTTSVEHAPAWCFFPTDKRINLTTVDSCTNHNEDTSKDDEYVSNIIAMSLGNNQVALDHFLKKCVSSFILSFSEIEQIATIIIALKNYFVTLPLVESDIESTLFENLKIQKVRFYEDNTFEFRHVSKETQKLSGLLNEVLK